MTVSIAVLKETRPHERRVALVPVVADKLARLGAQLRLQAGAGAAVKLADAAYKKVADALRPWTYDFHVAQNDGSVFGSGDHEKTGRHVQVNDPNGKLDVTKHAGYWLRDGEGNLTKKMRHIAWDGCMFPNAVMTAQQTWNDVLGAMIKVRDAHGWRE